MKTAVYNRYWPSRGGGERHSGMMAVGLARQGHEVDLLSPVDFDLDGLAAHLSLDLTGVKLRVIKDEGETKFAAASAEYDLLVNGTYMSTLEPLSGRSALLTFFPTPPDHELSEGRRRIAKLVGPHITNDPNQIHGYGFGLGWYPTEGGLRTKWSWSTDHGILELPHGGSEGFHVVLGRPGASGPAKVRIEDGDGELVRTLTVDQQFRRYEMVVPASSEPRELHIFSDTFSVPGDTRELGIALRQGGLGGDGVTSLVTRRFPWLRLGHPDLDYLTSYDSVVSNSAYTSGWIDRLWRVEADLLFPPIDVEAMRPESVRDKTIVTIGRFFDPVRGHSKRQLEMVEIFRRLTASGRLPAGWTLHMIGGCEPDNRPYFEKVMAAAEGLPIELHPNSPRHILERLVNRASIFWSATGMNENTELRPWRNEHFGMTTAESMAAGCVPVVIDRAGQQEIVRDGVDGFRWETIDQAVELTAKVAGDDDLRRRLAVSAMGRAREFSDDAFLTRWAEICDRRSLLDGGPAGRRLKRAAKAAAALKKPRHAADDDEDAHHDAGIDGDPQNVGHTGTGSRTEPDGHAQTDGHLGAAGAPDRTPADRISE